MYVAKYCNALEKSCHVPETCNENMQVKGGGATMNLTVNLDEKECL